MNKKNFICILGGTGVVGFSAYKTLVTLGYRFKIGVRNREKAYKLYADALDRVQLFEIEIDNLNKIKKICEGAKIIIGAVGPSIEYSKRMSLFAIELNIPYIDPGGMHLLNNLSLVNASVPVIVGAGVFPGLSGWMLYSMMMDRNSKDFIEMIIGGEYKFSRSSAVDYVEAKNCNDAGIPMACIRDGKIIPAQNYETSQFPDQTDTFVFLPYITKEIQEIVSEGTILNIDAYTAIPADVLAFMNKENVEDKQIIQYLFERTVESEQTIIWIKKHSEHKNELVSFDGNAPGELTGKVLAIAVDAIMHIKMENGIFTMAKYLSAYPLLKKLKTIDKRKEDYL